MPQNETHLFLNLLKDMANGEPFDVQKPEHLRCLEVVSESIIKNTDNAEYLSDFMFDEFASVLDSFDPMLSILYYTSLRYKRYATKRFSSEKKARKKEIAAASDYMTSQNQQPYKNIDFDKLKTAVEELSPNSKLFNNVAKLFMQETEKSEEKFAGVLPQNKQLFGKNDVEKLMYELCNQDRQSKNCPRREICLAQGKCAYGKKYINENFKNTCNNLAIFGEEDFLYQPEDE